MGLPYFILRTLVLFLTVAACASLSNEASAQSVRIQNSQGGWGFGWMFRYGTSCHVILPKHVAYPDEVDSSFPKVTVWSSSPVVTDGATVRTPFWEGLDLAEAVIDQGPFDNRCTATLYDLHPTEASRDAVIGFLHRITASGEIERTRLRLLDRKYLTFEGELLLGPRTIAQGTSGAFAYADGRPIGMALSSKGTSSALFIRSEEIAINMERWMDEQGRAFRQPPVTTPNGTPNDPVIREASSNTPPILPQYALENIFSDGLFVSKPTGPIEITIRLETNSPIPIQRVRMFAPSQGYAVPKNVVIFLDSGEEGTRFRYWTQTQMQPDGFLDTGTLAARGAQWLRLVIHDAWSDGDVAIERLIFE